MERDILMTLLDQGLSVEAIARQEGKHPSTVAYWMAKFGLEAPLRDKHAPKGGIERACLEALVNEGKSIAEIAGELERGKATIRHWLKKFGLSTGASVRIRELRTAKADGRTTVTLSCRRHGETEFALETSGYYRCKRCRMERVATRRRKTKAILVEEAGGRCVLCGYDRHVGALEFHHLDPTAKRWQISNGWTASLAILREEARKCVLLCSNCHAEVEGGVSEVPLEFQPAEREEAVFDTGHEYDPPIHPDLG